jgi:hypothetical protein
VIEKGTAGKDDFCVDIASNLTIPLGLRRGLWPRRSGVANEMQLSRLLDGTITDLITDFRSHSMPLRR